MKQAPDPRFFLIVFPLFWFAVTMLLSFLSGWFHAHLWPVLS
jgi:hypothetical protein